MKSGTYLKAIAVVAVLVLGIAGTYFLAGGAGQQGRSDEPLTMAQLEQWIDEYSNWGRWGEDDDLGAIQLITPEKRVQAAALVRDGITVSLAELQVPNVEEPGRSPPYRFEFTFRDNYEEYVVSNPWTAPPAERLMVGAHGSRSHLDALAHNFYNGQYYNGLPYTDITAEGTIRGGIENLRHGVVTRGILMDIPRLKGKAWLDAGEGVTVADLEAWEKEAGLKVGSGDAVLLNTGRWVRRAEEGTWQGGYPGFHASTVPWFKARDVAVVGTDGGLDVYPSGVPNSGAPVHTLVLTALGMPILDVMDLTEVSEAAAERKRWTFLLTAARIRVPNGTGSAINAIATF